MLALDLIAEQRIADAIASGEFDDLPGAGRPLELDDDRLVPEECRAAYRLLKNAGCAPPEVEARREQATLARSLLDACCDRRSRAIARIALIRTALELSDRAPPRR